MKKTQLLASGALAAMTVALPVPALAEAPAWQFHADHILGTSLDVTAVARDETSATTAAEAARNEIERLDAVFSGWRADSELASLNRSNKAAVSRELRDTLEAAACWRTLTNGAFDERLGEVERHWRQLALNTNEGTDQAALRKAVSAASQPFEPAAHPRTISRPAGVRIALDGFAKGVIIDAALEAARSAAPDVEGLLIDLGGDLRCWGRAPDPDGWSIGVADPLNVADNTGLKAVLKVTNKGVATSGRGDRDHVVGVERFSHLVDPRSGLPADRVAGVTVVADRAADADALATAFSVMPVAASLKLADNLPGVATSITTPDGFQYVSTRWDGWAAKVGEAQARAPVLLAQNADQRSGAVWPTGFSLAVQYEVPAISGGRYRRPYLAIWVTDTDGRIVRTILLLGTRPGWQRGNYQWSRAYASRQPVMVDATSRPTRAPGRYTAIWDGTDDAGRRVPQGVYTVHVEAARQYGGRSYGYADMDLFDTVTQREMRPREEFGGLRLTFGPAR